MLVKTSGKPWKIPGARPLPDTTSQADLGEHGWTRLEGLGIGGFKDVTWRKWSKKTYFQVCVETTRAPGPHTSQKMEF